MIAVLLFYRITSCVLIYRVEKNRKSKDIAFRLILQFLDIYIYYKLYRAFKQRRQKPSAAIFQIRRIEAYCESC